MDIRGVRNGHCREDVGDCVESVKAFVNGNFEYSGCRIDRAVHRADAFAVPAPAVQKRSLATGPSRSVDSGVETPCDKLVAAERSRQRRHV